MSESILGSLGDMQQIVGEIFNDKADFSEVSGMERRGRRRRYRSRRY